MAHSNAAYIIRRKMKTSPLMASVASPLALTSRNHSVEPFTLRDVLFAKSLVHSAQLGNAESAFQLGHLFFDGRGVAKDRAMASWWYSKASAAGHSMSKSNISLW